MKLKITTPQLVFLSVSIIPVLSFWFYILSYNKFNFYDTNKDSIIYLIIATMMSTTFCSMLIIRLLKNKSDEYTFIRKYAFRLHASVNHKYDNKPYSVHLNGVVDVVKRYLYLIPEKYHFVVICAAYLHDTIEDCRVTYNDILKITNKMIANIVYAVSNEKGKSRKERANVKYYTDIKDTEFATFIKLADRIANIEYSKKTKSRMYDVYLKENEHFINSLYVVNTEYQDMFDYLKSFNEKTE